MGEKNFLKPISWIWKYPKATLCFAIGVVLFDYAIGRLSGLDAYSATSRQVVIHAEEVQKRVGPIVSVGETGRRLFQGVPGKEARYPEYRYSVRGNSGTASVAVRLFPTGDGRIIDHTIAVE